MERMGQDVYLRLDRIENRVWEAEKQLLRNGEQIRTLMTRVKVIEESRKWLTQSITYIIMGGVVAVITGVLTAILRG